MSRCTGSQDRESTPIQEFSRLFERSLSFQYHRGGDRPFAGPCKLVVPEPLPYGVIGQVLKAALHLRIEGSPPLRVEPGGGYFIPPGRRNTGTVTQEGPVFFRWAHVSFTVLDSLDLFGIVDVPSAFSVATGIAIGRLLKEMQGLRRRPQEPSLYRAVRQQAIGLEMLTFLMEDGAVSAAGAALFRHLGRLDPVIRHIERHLGDPLTREALAGRAGLSETRFHAVFKEAFGMAPMEYVLRQRLRKAQRLLATTGTAVHSVGEACGFRDPFHFSRIFKKHVGSSPRSYREANGA